MRYHFLDNVRGITFLSMAAYHTMWDLVFIFGVAAAWYEGPLGHVWQQSILWSFILISGFCWGLSHKRPKRGLVVFAAGLLVSVVTFVALPDDPVIFGVLTFLGTAMLVLCPLKNVLERIPAVPGFVASVVLFVVLRDIPWGYLGFEGWHIVALPGEWYANLATAFFGFAPESFISSDYVPFLPWIFLYLCGYFIYRLLLIPKEDEAANARLVRLPEQKPWPVVGFIGRHSLGFYLLHQAVIYGVLTLFFTLVF